MLSVRAHPNDWAFYINKLACYQISITLYVQLVLESASLPQLPSFNLIVDGPDARCLTSPLFQ